MSSMTSSAECSFGCRLHEAARTLRYRSWSSAASRGLDKLGTAAAIAINCQRQGMIWNESIQLTPSVVLYCLAHDASNASKDRSRFQRRSYVTPFAVDLDHEDTDLQRTVDFAILHEISS